MALIKCGKCGKPYRIGAEQTGIDDRGLPIIHRYGYCDACELKNDLDAPTYSDYSQSWYGYHMGLIALSISILSMFTLTWIVGMVGSPISLCIGIRAVRLGNIYKKSAIAAIVISALCTFISIIAVLQIIAKVF